MGATNRVVCIEDEPEMIDLVRLILSRKGFQVVGAMGGREGLEVISREKPDLVLLDLMLPDMDGWEVYQKMKSDDDLREIPVIVGTVPAAGASTKGLDAAWNGAETALGSFGPQELL